MQSLPNILPSVKFPNSGNVSYFPCSFCFSWKKKEENLEKNLLDKNDSYYCQKYCTNSKSFVPQNGLQCIRG